MTARGNDASLDGGPLVDADASDHDALPEPEVRDDGRRRRRAAAAVVALAVLSAAVGGVVGSRLKSPADAASDRAAPPASRLTVPVERRTLSSSLTLSGEIRFAEPVPIALAGSVGVDAGDSVVVTRAPELDQTVAEGDVLLEVSGRPVIALVGALPMYRSLSLGSEGPDVLQVEEALERLGFDPGAVDGTFDAATAGAIDEFYSSLGHRSVGPTADDAERLRMLREAVTVAEENLRRAEADLASAGAQVTGSELLAIEQHAAQARDAVPQTEARVQRANQTANAAVSAAAVARDASVTIRDAARVQRNLAATPGAIDPATGEPYTADEIAAREAALAMAEQDVAASQAALSSAESDRATTAEQGTAEVRAARDARALAEAQLAETRRPADTTLARQARDDAATALDEARTDRDRVAATTGTRLAPGELVFLPSLPSTVTDVAVRPGNPVADVLLTVSSAETQIAGRVSSADAGLVQVGAPVTIELRDRDLAFPGVIASVGPPASTDGGGGGGGGGGGSSGRLEVLVAPEDPAALRDFVYSGVRIVIDIASTGDEVLVVPVAAISVGGDGSSRVEVEREPITTRDEGRTDVVRVDVGLAAQGLVEVRPIGAPLHEGDRVVVGIERRRTDSEPEREREPDPPLDPSGAAG